MKTVKIGNHSEAYAADQANTLYTMAKNKEITTSGYGLDILGDAKHREFQIDGKIYGDFTTVRIGLSDAYVDKVDFRLGASAELTAGVSGIVSYGFGSTIRNAGTIDAVEDGILTYGDQTIVNSGEISAKNGINIFAAEGVSTTIRNTGSISGTQWAIFGGSESEKVINKGDITGNVQLSSGNDTFIFKGGHIDGIVYGGGGDETYVVSAKGLNIFEDDGENTGTDVVRASVSYELQDNIEDLYLTGKRNIDGSGNAGANHLYGNAGNNHLMAGEGFDTLNGGAGNDVLEGGADADGFYFQRGTGRDIVADFQATIDDIHFYDLKGANNFAGMIENHAKEQNGDVVLTFGKDVIVIQDHAIADLQEADFHFNV